MNPAQTAPTGPGSWLEQALAVLALRLRHEVALIRALRGPDRKENFLGLFVSGEEAEAILAEASGRLRASGTAAAAAEIHALDQQLADARMADPDGIWCRLAERFGLGEAELDLLILTAAPALDPRIGRVYGFLNDDMARRYLTPALALRLLDRHDADFSAVRRMLSADAPLRAAGMVSVGVERPLIEAPLRIDEDLLDRLLGGDMIPPALARHCEVLPVPRGGPPVPAGIWLLDGTGSAQGPGGAAIELAGRLDLDILLIEADRLEAQHRPRTELVSALIREARLIGALPVLDHFDASPAVERHETAARLTAPAVIITRHPVAWEDAGVAGAPLPQPSFDRRSRITALLAGHPADSADLRAWLTRLGRLDLLALSRLLGRHGCAEDLRAAVRARMSQDLIGLAELVTSDFSLADLVLPSRTRTGLQTLVAWQDTAVTVRNEWGLGTVFGKSASIIALFKGPSGTGKTMAASAVANTLGLPLFRVNLAGLVSKYIGETEKNLDRLFAAAETADVVLFFDEADAIFGRRSEVQDAHDRYANLETAYLLQRLEAYDGIAVLASNLHQNIDDAFLRRIDFMIEFPAPGQDARRAIWRRIHTGAAPLDEHIDLDLLADRFELTGGEIRNCCLAAAHIAAANGGVIDMAALMQAVGRELAKAGKPIRKASFGPHYAALRVEEDPS